MNWFQQFSGIELNEFISKIKSDKLMWFAKRLSGNDTNLTGGHQVGVYVPREVIKYLAPEVLKKDKLNPDRYIDEAIYINDDISAKKQLRIIYYNNRFATINGTRNEFRITRWGGKNCSVQDPERTGSILLFVWLRVGRRLYAASWVSENINEEEQIEKWIGEPVLPGEFILPISRSIKKEMAPFDLSTIPQEWFLNFPGTKDIYNYVFAQANKKMMQLDPDKALMWGRQAEFALFKKLEKNIVEPMVKGKKLTVEDIVRMGNVVANRRRSRSGKSLELHLAGIFFINAIQFEEQKYTEGRKKPDFIFPSSRMYHNCKYPVAGLNMLGAKSCCKDRWRQVINEANRIESKHLFTLQEGVSEHQMEEMKSEKVQLVVPRQNVKSFPSKYRANLITLKDFIETRRAKQTQYPVEDYPNS